MDNNAHSFTLSPADALALRYGAEAAPSHGPWNARAGANRHSRPIEFAT
jgi:hypothetical protein